MTTLGFEEPNAYWIVDNDVVINCTNISNIKRVYANLESIICIVV